MKEEKRDNKITIKVKNVKNYDAVLKLDIMFLNLIIVVLELMGMKRAFRYSYRTLRFYTTDSNIMVLITSAVMVLCALVCIIKKSDIPTWAVMLKYFSTCCITMTFVIVMVVLLPGKLSKGYGFFILYHGAQIYHHTLCPIISIITYVFFEKRISINFNCVLVAIIPTIIYGIVIIILNLKDIVYGPYPFLHIKEQSVIVSIFWAILLYTIANSINVILYRIRFIHKRKTANS